MRSVDFQKCRAVPAFERDGRRQGEGFSMNARAWAKEKGEDVDDGRLTMNVVTTTARSRRRRCDSIGMPSDAALGSIREAAGLAEDEEDYDQEAELDARLRAESEMHERDLYEERGQSRRGRTRPRALEEGEDEWLRPGSKTPRRGSGGGWGDGRRRRI